MSAVITMVAACDRLTVALTAGAVTIIDRVVAKPIHNDIDLVADHAFGRDGTPFKDRPYRVTVRDETVATATGFEVRFKLAPKGFWVMGQYGAEPHLIDSKKTGGRLKSRSAAHPVRGPIKHPGSRGKGAIDGAWAVIRQGQANLIPAAVDEIMGAWDG
jgi:hypothetical protein